MLTVRKLALVWGCTALALAAGGCDADGRGPSALTEPSAPAARGPAAPRVGPGGTTGAPGAARAETPSGSGDLLGFDIAAAPTHFVDDQGHLLEVRWVADASGQVVGAQHLRDGVLLAQTGEAVAGTDLLVYSGNVLVLQEFIMAGAPLGAAAGGRRPPRDEGRPSEGGPRRAMLYLPCEPEWQAYAAASGGLLIAVASYQTRPSARTRVAVYSAAVAFVGTWVDLYQCMEDYYSSY